VANQRNRKKRISCLETPEGLLEDNNLMLNYAVDFYKTLFGDEPISEVKLDENFEGLEDKVTVDENKMLEASFTEKEIKTAIYESYAEGAPGPDGFSFLFYHHFWDLIKTDFMNLVKDFE
jgi:hypothetical protein